jgi:hypothetical protein
VRIYGGLPLLCLKSPSLTNLYQKGLPPFNRAEKPELLKSVEQRQRLRELPNQTTHEYPDNLQLPLIGLRRLVEHVPMLLQIDEQLTRVAETRVAAQ